MGREVTFQAEESKGGLCGPSGASDLIQEWLSTGGPRCVGDDGRWREVGQVKVWALSVHEHVCVRACMCVWWGVRGK